MSLGGCQGSVHILLADEAFHCSIGLVCVDGDRGFLVLRIVNLVGRDVAHFLHVLLRTEAVRVSSCMYSMLAFRPCGSKRVSILIPYLDLFG